MRHPTWREREQLRAIMAAICANPRHTYTTLSNATGISRTTLCRRVNTLVAMGFLAPVDHKHARFVRIVAYTFA